MTTFIIILYNIILCKLKNGSFQKIAFEVYVLIPTDDQSQKLFIKKKKKKLTSCYINIFIIPIMLNFSQHYF